jgi:hypothetical protein
MCRTDPRKVDYRIVNRTTGQRAEAGDPEAKTVCAECGEEIEL